MFKKGIVAWNKGKNLSMEEREKISISTKKAMLSLSKYKKDKMRHIGMIPFNKGKIGIFKHSEETKKKMSEIAKSRGFGR